MRKMLPILTLLLASSDATAQIILDPNEVINAAGQCAEKVNTSCLFTLALHALATQTTGPKNPLVVSNIALAQARAGDIAGATRSLSFGPARPEVFLAMGQWDAAYALAKEGFPNIIVEFGTAEGSFKMQMVQSQLEQNQLDLALRTAASITNPDEHDRALRLVLDTLPPVEATALANQMRNDSARDPALLDISQTQIAQADLVGAVETANAIINPSIKCEALTALAAAQTPSIARQTLIDAARTVEEPRDALFDGFRPVTCLLAISDLYRHIGNRPLAAITANNALTYLENLPPQFPPNMRLVMQTRAATALALAGDQDGNRFLDGLPPTDLRIEERYQLAAARYIAFTRLNDQRAMDELSQLLALAKTTPIYSTVMTDAASELVNAGFPKQALALAALIETLPYTGGQTYNVYLQVTDNDLKTALDALSHVEIDYIRIGMATSVARKLLGNGDNAHARRLLSDTVHWLLVAPDTNSPLGDWKVSLLAEVAKAQNELGFSEDASATLQTAFAEYQKIDRTHFRVSALLAIAAAFRD